MLKPLLSLFHSEFVLRLPHLIKNNNQGTKTSKFQGKLTIQTLITLPPMQGFVCCRYESSDFCCRKACSSNKYAGPCTFSYTTLALCILIGYFNLFTIIKHDWYVPHVAPVPWVFYHQKHMYNFPDIYMSWKRHRRYMFFIETHK